MATRIQVPAQVRPGEVIEVRVLIQHPMETGYRADNTGKPIPRNTIRSFSCTYNGAEVFRADLSSGIAANPYLQFTMMAGKGGTLECTWVDDAGQKETTRQPVNVAG